MVKPTVGLPLFLGTVALIALLVHAAILNNTTWYGAYWNGHAKARVAAYLKLHNDAKASISGYHDPSGNKEHHQKLAKERAFVVRDALAATGIAAERVALEKPVETTGTRDPRDARRVEVTITP